MVCANGAENTAGNKSLNFSFEFVAGVMHISNKNTNRVHFQHCDNYQSSVPLTNAPNLSHCYFRLFFVAFNVPKHKLNSRYIFGEHE